MSHPTACGCGNRPGMPPPLRFSPLTGHPGSLDVQSACMPQPVAHGPHSHHHSTQHPRICTSKSDHPRKSRGLASLLFCTPTHAWCIALQLLRSFRQRTQAQTRHTLCTHASPLLCLRQHGRLGLKSHPRSALYAKTHSAGARCRSTSRNWRKSCGISNMRALRPKMRYFIPPRRRHRPPQHPDRLTHPASLLYRSCSSGRQDLK
jgi:hypothetical protein